MRIELVITELYVGGAERCMTQLAIGLQKRGHSVRVHSIGQLPLDEQTELVDRIRLAGISVLEHKGRGWADSWSVKNRLTHCFSRVQPDVCQSFLFHANVLATFAAHDSGIPVIVGGLRVAEDRRTRSWLESRAVRRMDRLVCVSQATAEFAKRALRVDHEKLEVIGNSVDVARFQSAKPIAWSRVGWPNDSRVMLFVGRLHPQKGIELLQRQVERITSPDRGTRLLLIGDGPLRQRLERWAVSIGQERVQILPWQSDIAPYVAAAEMLVLPSHYEGMPNVVLEAMAAGNPVVCSRVEGSTELLAHTSEFQSFRPGDDDEMAEKILRLQEDRQHGIELGSQNAMRMVEDFSVDAMVDRYEELYLSLRRTKSGRA